LTPSGHAELLTKDVGVRLGGARGNAKALADLLVRAPCGDELDDLALPLGYVRKRVPQGVVHAARR
jgi:hypothetical protein